MGDISILPGARAGGEAPGLLAPELTEPANAFHRSMPEYRPTPLVALPALAKRLGVGRIYVKDESKRFGLNAFKGLGTSWAAHCLTAGQADERAAFVTATDGNHGRAVAWAARRLGRPACVFMPRGSRPCRAEAIRAEGNARVEITDWNYDDTVRHAADYARRTGGLLLQDTGLEDYEQVPGWIVQGYTTMAVEAVEQMEAAGDSRPTHVFLQAGVGSFAGGILGWMVHRFGDQLPVTAIVEPEQAACVYASAQAGRLVALGGNPETEMAGLNCGEPNPYTWPILRDFAAFYVKCPDWVTELGMRLLAGPEGADAPVVSGESGAVSLGLLAALCGEEKYAPLRRQLGLDEQSVVLVFSTEGDTDPEHYRQVVEGSAQSGPG